jgi:amino-acid N-acetyltransferase
MHAKELGAKEVFLLTDTAEKFFDKAGFQKMNRADAPARISEHKQLTQLCPSSAVLMWKQL